MARAKRNINDAFNSPFATRLRELIDKTGISQTDLAAAVGVTRQAVNSYTLGNTVPNSDVLANIAKHFEVSADYLLGLSDVKSVNVTIKEICNMTGLSEKSIKNCELLNRIKKLQKELRELRMNSPTDSKCLSDENDYMHYELENKFFSYIDVINYFTENFTKYWDGMEVLRDIATLNTECDPYDIGEEIEEELYHSNPELSKKIEAYGRVIAGKDYAAFLQQYAKDEFSTMVSDYRYRINPYEDERDGIFILPRHEESLIERCNILKKRISEIKAGEHSGNDRKEE